MSLSSLQQEKTEKMENHQYFLGHIGGLRLVQTILVKYWETDNSKESHWDCSCETKVYGVMNW